MHHPTAQQGFCLGFFLLTFVATLLRKRVAWSYAGVSIEEVTPWSQELSSLLSQATFPL